MGPVCKEPGPYFILEPMMTRKEYKKYISGLNDNDLYIVARKLFVKSGESSLEEWKTGLIREESAKRGNNLLKKAMEDSFRVKDYIENGKINSTFTKLRIDTLTMDKLSGYKPEEEIERTGIFSCNYDGDNIPKYNIKKNDNIIIDNEAYPYEGALMALHLNGEFKIFPVKNDDLGLFIHCPTLKYNPDSDRLEIIGIIRQVIRGI